MFSRFCSSSSLPAWLGFLCFFLWRQQGTALGLSGSVHVQPPCRGVAQLAARGALRHSTANVCTKTCSYHLLSNLAGLEMAWHCWAPGPDILHLFHQLPLGHQKPSILEESAHEDRLLISTAVSGLLHWTASSYPTRRYFSSNSKESWENVGDFGHFQSSFIAVKCKMPCCIDWFQIDRAQENTILWGLNCSQRFSQPQAAELIMPVSTWKFCHVISCRWKRERHQWDTLPVAITIVP